MWFDTGAFNVIAWSMLIIINLNDIIVGVIHSDLRIVYINSWKLGLNDI